MWYTSIKRCMVTSIKRFMKYVAEFVREMLSSNVYV